MSILVLLELTAQPGKLDDLRAMFADMLPDTRRFAGNEAASLHVEQDDPTKAVLVERWDARGSYDAYVAWRTSQNDPRLGALIAAPPVMRVLEDLDA